MHIGMFMPAKDGGWIGYIRTLTIDAKVRVVPNDDCSHDNAPDFVSSSAIAASATPGKSRARAKARRITCRSGSTTRAFPSLSSPRSSPPKAATGRGWCGADGGSRPSRGKRPSDPPGLRQST